MLLNIVIVFLNKAPTSHSFGVASVSFIFNWYVKYLFFISQKEKLMFKSIINSIKSAVSWVRNKVADITATLTNKINELADTAKNNRVKGNNTFLTALIEYVAIPVLSFAMVFMGLIEFYINPNKVKLLGGSTFIKFVNALSIILWVVNPIGMLVSVTVTSVVYGIIFACFVKSCINSDVSNAKAEADKAKEEEQQTQAQPAAA